MSRFNFSFVSGNANKVAEVNQILKGVNPNVKSFSRPQLPRQLVQPTQPTETSHSSFSLQPPCSLEYDITSFSSPTRATYSPLAAGLPPSAPRTPQPQQRKRRLTASDCKRLVSTYHKHSRSHIPIFKPGQVRLQLPPENVSDETMHLCNGLLLSSPEIVIRYAEDWYGMKVYFEKGGPEPLEEDEYYEVQPQTEEEYRKSVGFPSVDEYSQTPSPKKPRNELFGGGLGNEFRYARLVKRKIQNAKEPSLKILSENEQKRKVEMEYGIKLISTRSIVKAAKANGRYRPTKRGSEVAPITGFVSAPSSSKEPTIQKEMPTLNIPPFPMVFPLKTPEKLVSKKSGNGNDGREMEALFFDVFKVERPKKSSQNSPYPNRQFE